MEGRWVMRKVLGGVWARRGWGASESDASVHELKFMSCGPKQKPEARKLGSSEKKSLCMGSEVDFRLRLHSLGFGPLLQAKSENKFSIKRCKRKWTFGAWLKCYFRLRLEIKACSQSNRTAGENDPSVHTFEGWLSTKAQFVGLRAFALAFASCCNRIELLFMHRSPIFACS